MNIRTLDELTIANANTIRKGFSNSNPNFRQMFVQYSTSRRSVSKFTFYLNWSQLIANLTFNLKIFEEVLSQLHGNYKQDICDEGNPNSGKSVT